MNRLRRGDKHGVEAGVIRAIPSTARGLAYRDDGGSSRSSDCRVHNAGDFADDGAALFDNARYFTDDHAAIHQARIAPVVIVIHITRGADESRVIVNIARIANKGAIRSDIARVAYESSIIVARVANENAIIIHIAIVSDSAVIHIAGSVISDGGGDRRNI